MERGWPGTRRSQWDAVEMRLCQFVPSPKKASGLTFVALGELRHLVRSLATLLERSHAETHGEGDRLSILVQVTPVPATHRLAENTQEIPSENSRRIIL